ncbi:MAG: M28 family peptidase [candidate division WOR-3 bacterium]
MSILFFLLSEGSFLAVAPYGSGLPGDILSIKGEICVLRVSEADTGGITVLEEYDPPYYWARILREGGLDDVRAAGRVLYQKGKDVLFRLENPHALYTGRIMVRRLPEEPVELNIWGPDKSGKAYDPLIAEMVGLVDSTRYLNFVDTLQGFVTRNSHHSQCAAAANYAKAYLQSLGLDEVYLHTYSGSYAPNVIGIKYGKESDSVVIICGHLDATAGWPWLPEDVAPGADDNGSGSSVVLEAARVTAGYDFRREIRYILFTGEEQGLVGSDYYAYQHRNDPIVGVLNFDMVGYSNNNPESIDIIGNNPSVWLVDSMISCLNTYVSGWPYYRLIDGSFEYSDHGSFWNYGKYALCVIEDHDVVNPFYHSKGDTIGAGFEDLKLAWTCTKLGVATLAALAEPLGTSVGERSPSGPEVSLVPSKGGFTLIAQGQAEVRVYDVSGRQVERRSFTGKSSFSFDPGVYLISVKIGNQTSFLRAAVAK